MDIFKAPYGYGYGYYGRKKREADPAVLAVKHSAPTAVIPPPVPYGLGENFLAPAAPHLHTVEHKATEVIPGAVAAGATPVGYAGKKFDAPTLHPLCTCSCPLVHPYGYALGYGYGFHHAPTVGYTVEHKISKISQSFSRSYIKNWKYL